MEGFLSFFGKFVHSDSGDYTHVFSITLIRTHTHTHTHTHSIYLSISLLIYLSFTLTRQVI